MESGSETIDIIGNFFIISECWFMWGKGRPSEATGKGPGEGVSVECVGGDAGEHERPTGGGEFGGHKRNDFGFVEFAT